MNAQLERSENILNFAGRIVLFCALISLYLQLSFGFPFLPFILSSSFLFLFLRFRLPLIDILIPFVLMASFWLLILTLRNPGQFGEQSKSWVIFLLSIGTSTCLAFKMKELGTYRISKWFLWISVALISGSALEVLGPLQGLSDTVRSALYNESIIYTNDARDLLGVGFVRPKLFTSEPSHLAKFLFCALVFSAVSSKDRRWHLVLCIVGYLVIRSSVILLVVPLILAINFVELSPRSPRSPLKLVLFLSFVVGGGTLFVVLGHQRLGLFGGEIEASAFMRIVRPAYVAFHALQERPFFGFGLGSESEISGHYLNATFAFKEQVYAQQRAAEGSLGTWGSVHFAAPVQFGILGFGLFLLSVDWVRGILGCSRMVFWTFYVVYGTSVGAINTPLLWGPLVIIAAIGGWVNCPVGKPSLPR